MTMKRIGIQTARGLLGDIVSDAQRDRKTTIITRNGKDAAAVVPLNRVSPAGIPQLKEDAFEVGRTVRERVRTLARLLESAARECAGRPNWADMSLAEKVWNFCHNSDGVAGSTIDFHTHMAIMREIKALTGMAALEAVMTDHRQTDSGYDLLMEFWLERVPGQISEPFGYVHPKS